MNTTTTVPPGTADALGVYGVAANDAQIQAPAVGQPNDGGMLEIDSLIDISRLNTHLYPTPVMPIENIVYQINQLVHLHAMHGNSLLIRIDSGPFCTLGALEATPTDVVVLVGTEKGPQSPSRLSHTSCAWLHQALVTNRHCFLGEDTQRRRFEAIISKAQKPREQI